MKEAIGGTVSLQIILIFLVFINSFLAFSVSYTKAFRMKNKIISVIQNNEGYTSESVTQIENYAKSIGYTGKKSAKAEDYMSADQKSCNRDIGYCISKTPIHSDDTTAYYTVITFIHTDFPILSTVLDSIPAFKITGQTSTIYNISSSAEKF